MAIRMDVSSRSGDVVVVDVASSCVERVDCCCRT